MTFFYTVFKGSPKQPGMLMEGEDRKKNVYLVHCFATG